MGSGASKNFITNDLKNRQIRARTIYNYRIQIYDPIEDGPPIRYMRQIQAEYKLNCIHEYLIIKPKKKENNKSYLF